MWQVFFEKIFATFSRQRWRSDSRISQSNMSVMEWLATSPEETERCGYQLARQMDDPAMVALIGAMGAGKTHFAKGFARGLGYEGDVTSPTFSIVQEYHGGRMPLFHFDWYRMKSADELLALGWDDCLDQGAILLVEWADLFPQLWTSDAQVVCLETIGEGRKILYQR
jgi:tRNA threonylcarbamoyladenosine biosynthesis protein TsaE